MSDEDIIVTHQSSKLVNYLLTVHFFTSQVSVVSQIPLVS